MSRCNGLWLVPMIIYQSSATTAIGIGIVITGSY